MTTRAAYILLLLFVAQFALASSIIEADRAYLEGNYELAVRRYTPLAEDGNVTAQYNLGVIYEDHLIDHGNAFYWMQKAARQGDADAQIRLGSMYKTGTGTLVNLEKAVSFYRLSAEQGNVHAQSNLADIYLNGRGVEQNFARGVFWLMKAADNGHAHAQYILGVMFLQGDRVARDMTRADHYLRGAAVQGHEDALKFFETD